MIETKRCRFEEAAEDDIERIIEIENHKDNRNFIWIGTPSEHLAEINDPNHFLWMIRAKDDNRIVGYGLARVDKKSNVFELRRIAMFIAVIVNIIVSRILYKVAKEEESVALEADALHLKTDVYTSLGVCLGLILIRVTGIYILDPMVAICVALLILKESWNLISSAFQPLMDVTLSDDELKRIVRVVQSYAPPVVNAHKLRTRKSGNIRIIDFHLIVDSEMSVTTAHDLCEEIEQCIERNLKNCDVQIHIEPESHLESTTKSNLW